MSAIRHMLAKSIFAKVKAKCFDDVPESDEARIDKIGIRAVDLKGKERLVMTIKHFDPMRTEQSTDSNKGAWSDASMYFRNKNWPDRLSGGQIFKTVVGVIELSAQLTGKTQEEADEIIQLALARAENAIQSGRGLIGLVDEFGEKVMDFAVMGVSEYPSGSQTFANSKYFLRWAALTLTAPQEQ